MAFLLALIVISVVVAVVKFVCVLMKKRKKPFKVPRIRVVPLETEEQLHLFDKMCKCRRVVGSVNRLIDVLLIGAFLWVIVFSVSTHRCPSPKQVIAAWERLARDYRDGAITFEVLIRRARRLIKCGVCASPLASPIRRGTRTCPSVFVACREPLRLEA